jgi:hypothetical protein
MLYSGSLLAVMATKRHMAAHLRPYLMLVFAIPALLAGGLYALLSRQSVLGGATVFYPGLMLYNGTAEALSTAILLVAIGLLGLWIPQALGRRPRYQLNGLAVALALIGTSLACWGTLPKVFAPYLHLGRATLGSHVYQLGVRYTASGDSSYVLCECDSLGLICQCHDLPGAGRPLAAQTQLQADPATGTLAIQAGQQLVYRFHP